MRIPRRMREKKRNKLVKSIFKYRVVAFTAAWPLDVYLWSGMAGSLLALLALRFRCCAVCAGCYADAREVEVDNSTGVTHFKRVEDIKAMPLSMVLKWPTPRDVNGKKRLRP